MDEWKVKPTTSVEQSRMPLIVGLVLAALFFVHVHYSGSGVAKASAPQTTAAASLLAIKHGRVETKGTHKEGSEGTKFLQKFAEYASTHQKELHAAEQEAKKVFKHVAKKESATHMAKREADLLRQESNIMVAEKHSLAKEKESIEKHAKVLAELEKALTEKNEKKQVEFLKKDQQFLDGERRVSRDFHELEAEEASTDQKVEDLLDKVTSKEKERHEKLAKEGGALHDEWQKLELKHDELLKTEDKLGLAALKAKYSVLSARERREQKKTQEKTAISGHHS